MNGKIFLQVPAIIVEMRIWADHFLSFPAMAASMGAIVVDRFDKE
jgi:hypothetical protein